MKMRERGREEGRLPATLELEEEEEEEEEGEEGEEESEIPLGMKWIGCRMDGHKKQEEVLQWDGEKGDRWEVPVGMRACEKRGVHEQELAHYSRRNRRASALIHGSGH